jgi:hypothetical protein
MDPAEQLQALYDDVWAVVCRYRSEFDISVAGGIGVLEMVKLRVYNEAADREAEDQHQ